MRLRLRVDEAMIAAMMNLRRPRARFVTVTLLCMLATSLGAVTVVSPTAASGAVLRVPHSALLKSCSYADRTFGPRSTVQRACPQALPSDAAQPQPWWYENPVSGPSADPSALSNDGTGSDYYSYTTGGLFPVQHSTDLVTWTSAGTALARRPSWVVQSGDWHAWSPSVLQDGRSCPGATSPSCYYLYYVGLSAQFSVNCVGVAISPTPGGPFTDTGPLSNGILDNSGRPIGCGDDAGYGNIDPAPYVDTNGNAYLYVSSERACPPGSTSCTSANSAAKPTISVIPLAPSRLQASGARVALLSGGQRWEQAPWATVVEGPWVEQHNGVYYLFYSGGAYTGAYGMGYATMPSPVGPATEAAGNPILSGTARVYSPGGGSVVTGPDGGDWMLYHARLGGYNQPRQLFLDPVLWRPDGTVVVSGPSIGRDLTPVVSAPERIEAEATSAAGAMVRFEVSAVDYRGQALPTDCPPASWSVFPIGTTTVTCSATDSGGRVGSASFEVTVTDTSRPVMNVPPQVVVQTKNPAGAIIRYSARAIDVVDGMIKPRCVPASGHRFPIGTTIVECTATDRAGNTGAASFSVTVLGVPEVSALSVSPRTFMLTGRLVGGRCLPTSTANRGNRPCVRQIALHIIFRLNLPSQVTLTLSRAAPGELVNGRCQPTVTPNRRNRACTRLIRLPTRINRPGKPGTNTITLSGRADTSGLVPGSYQLTANVTNPANDTNPATATFKINR